MRPCLYAPLPLLKFLSVYLVAGACLLQKSAAADQIVLKSGTTITGIIMTDQETPDKLMVNVSSSPGIIDGQEISKSSVEKIVWDNGESDPAYKLKLPDRSTTADWYSSAISHQLQTWLKRYPHSALQGEMQQKIVKFQSELDRVKSGEYRDGEKWYTAGERLKHKLENEASDLLAEIKAAVAAGDFLTFSSLVDQNTARYRQTSVYPQITAFVQETVRGTTPEMIKSSVGRCRASMDAQWDDTVARVKKIVNQPVRAMTRTPDMRVGNFAYWAGSDRPKPNFNTVDVRESQNCQFFTDSPYATCDLHPGVVYFGSELEFNEMTKYFYIDLTIPKKKLTEPEMLEINRLYRILGRIESDRPKLDDLINNPSGLLYNLKQLAARLSPPPSTPLSNAVSQPATVTAAETTASTSARGSNYAVYGIYLLGGIVVLATLMGLKKR